MTPSSHNVVDQAAKRGTDGHALLKELQHNPLLWLLAFVPVVLVAQKLKPEAHTLLFVLSVVAIVPLATLLSHATESVAAKTGDAVGGLLNATLGNLTELVIALAALRAGEYMLVKASIAGAIVTNWPTKPATGCATIKNGSVSSVTAVNGGAGYSSQPQVTIPGHPEIKLKAVLSFGRDMATNGSVSSITVEKAGMDGARK